MTGDAMRWLEQVTGDLDGLLDAPLEALGRALNELAEAGGMGFRARLRHWISSHMRWKPARSGFFFHSGGAGAQA